MYTSCVGHRGAGVAACDAAQETCVLCGSAVPCAVVRSHEKCARDVITCTVCFDTQYTAAHPLAVSKIHG